MTMDIWMGVWIMIAVGMMILDFMTIVTVIADAMTILISNL
jgi:hypothetical protein